MNNAPMLGRRHTTACCPQCTPHRRQRKDTARGRHVEDRAWQREQLAEDMHEDDYSTEDY